MYILNLLNKISLQKKNPKKIIFPRFWYGYNFLSYNYIIFDKQPLNQ